jgi:hypothetical protein
VTLSYQFDAVIVGSDLAATRFVVEHAPESIRWLQQPGLTRSAPGA